MKTEPVLLMLIGIPGSGKSTWLNGLEETTRDGGKYCLYNDMPFYVVCPDKIRKQLSGNISNQSINIQLKRLLKILNGVTLILPLIE